jgi:N-acetyl-alpha-D-glucosaminyl L-malate synthase BshA
VKIGVTCFATQGGSGVIAAELGMSLAQRGHDIHFICPELPFRIEELSARMYFHPVHTVSYPVFTSPPYVLALASKMSLIARDAGLDLVHVHYAIPHAVAAYLAREVSGRRFCVITTVHGTDTRLVGLDPSLRPITRFALGQSDGVTAVSRDLAEATRRDFNLDFEIATIPNFVDPDEFSRRPPPGLRERFAPPGVGIVAHISNFRSVKRPQDAVRAFERIRRRVDARLMMVGDGPEREPCQRLALELGLGDSVHFLGGQQSVAGLLSVSDVFLLPSELESFGLAALEAMSCEVPVVAYAVGGVPEVVVEGETGHLVPMGDVEGMAERALDLLLDDRRRRALGEQARRRAAGEFSRERIVAVYECYYQALIEQCERRGGRLPAGGE